MLERGDDRFEDSPTAAYGLAGLVRGPMGAQLIESFRSVSLAHGAV